MLDVSLDRALGIFDRARVMFRLSSRYVSTVLGVCFYNARRTFGRARGPRYASTVLGVSSDDRARVIFRQCSNFFPMYSRYVSTVLKVYFDRARGRFRHCSRYVLTTLDVYFDRA